MARNFKIDRDYVEVAERIRRFKSTYPDGTLQPVDYDNPYIVQEIAGETVIVYRAAAYRTPDDPRPGIGVASEPYPGKTPYTKGSEIQNAETSAWGRAIVALGIPMKRVASSEEVRNREAERSTQRDEQREQAVAARQEGLPAVGPPLSDNGTITQAQAKRLHENLLAKGRDSRWFLGVLAGKGVGDGKHLTNIPTPQYESLLEMVAGFTDPPGPAVPAAAPAPTPAAAAADFAEAAQPAQEPAVVVAAAGAATTPTSLGKAPAATQEAPVAAAGASGGEIPPGMDVAAAKAYFEAKCLATTNQSKSKRKATVTPQQLTRLGAQCAELERLGVGRDEWRLYMMEKEGVSSRTELTKAAATRIIDYLARWIIDIRTGVAGPGEKTVVV